jgi:PIN domain nuclease of toxin-antitoxin system
LILLDTHVLLWMAVAPERLTKAASSAIPMDGQVAISTISAQEIAYLETRGKIGLDRPAEAWVHDVLAEHEIETIPPDLASAIRAGSLPADVFPGDPVDRVIYGTAVERGIRLVSADQRLRDFDPARVVW